MGQAEFLDTKDGRRIAYVYTPPKLGTHGRLEPTVVFLSGLKSDMEGTKAVALEGWATCRGLGFLRFDYSGHGQSSGRFEDGCIGDWHADTLAAVDALTEGPLVVVGSSMGGWQALLLARARAERIRGMVGIAAAPDFTEDGYWAGFDAGQRDELAREGFLRIPSDYEEDYIITQRLIEDGRAQMVLRSPLDLPFPVRLLQGTADTAVPVSQAVKLLEHATSPDMRLLLVKDADHSFSTPECLGLIEAAIMEVLA
ncbi:MAG: alpha/beta hydrolase [Rhodobacterales bacterium]|nr:MAG: alpha/beta hydrolase [Rhodobacterales bacterium]PIE09197.1 MAG: alpha/beta hydrolase [Rhodobacterales bacterium]